MKTQMHCFRKKALVFSATAAFSLLFAVSCQKHEDLKPTPQELDTIKAHSIDYALQVIPDIHEVMANAHDLLNVMDTIPQVVKDAQGNVIHNSHGGDSITYFSALHFGDNPPDFLKVVDNDTLGFSGTPIIRLKYIPSDPNYEMTMTTGQPMPYTEYLLISDQHRGVAKLDYKRVYIDISYGEIHQYYIEYANVDEVYIMGEAPYFTIYFTQKRIKENSSDSEDFGSNEYIIISGELTSAGIKDYYFGMKIKQFDLPGFEGNGYNVNDIDLIHIDLLPFTYWDPSQHYN